GTCQYSLSRSQRLAVGIRLVQNAAFANDERRADELGFAVAVQLNLEYAISAPDYGLIGELIGKSEAWSKTLLSERAQGAFANAEFLCRLNKRPVRVQGELGGSVQSNAFPQCLLVNHEDGPLASASAGVEGAQRVVLFFGGKVQFITQSQVERQLGCHFEVVLYI